MTSIGSILGGAFRLVRQNPLSVLVWGLLYLAAMALFLVAMRPFFQLYADLFSQQLAAGIGKPLRPEDLQPIMLRMQAASGLVFLAEIGLFALQMVLFTASQRAALRPAERGFFHLRLGGDELRLIGLGFFLMICLSMGAGLAMLVLAIFVGIAAFASGSPAVAGLLFALGFLVLMGAMIYVLVRLSLAPSLTFMRGNFVVGEAWRLSRGRFWTLFGAYFVIGLVQWVLGMVLLTFALAPLVSEMAAAGNGPEALGLAFQHQMERVANLDPVILLLGLGFAVLSGLSIALFGGAVATAARDLAGDADGGAIAAA